MNTISHEGYGNFKMQKIYYRVIIAICKKPYTTPNGDW